MTRKGDKKVPREMLIQRSMNGLSPSSGILYLSSWARALSTFTNVAGKRGKICKSYLIRWNMLRLLPEDSLRTMSERNIFQYSHLVALPKKWSNKVFCKKLRHILNTKRAQKNIKCHLVSPISRFNRRTMYHTSFIKWQSNQYTFQ